MKLIKRIFKVITAMILISTVALVAFILIADASDMEFKSKGEETPVVEHAITIPGIQGLDLREDDCEEEDESMESTAFEE